MAVVRGAHEVASGPAAHAADREPSGPLTATVGVLTHTLGTVFGLPASGTGNGGTAPAGSGDACDRTPSAAGPPENITTTPALPPLDGLTHGVSAPHSEAATADANRCRLPTPPHGYARPAANPLPPSRTSRPGIRPA
ncbi:hypothetical protein [Micromonospora sp. CNB394]|uniref:hypothetical protein n=1 Tax=Micromonospora sp. CNB394 TaxID=1169151 RepID=UPI0003738AD1|nr:hypothetical protein [Micromonospora sp. CNB394]